MTFADWLAEVYSGVHNIGDGERALRAAWDAGAAAERASAADRCRALLHEPDEKRRANGDRADRFHDEAIEDCIGSILGFR